MHSASLRLYQRKEKEFVNMRREVYDLDPRFMLRKDGATFVHAAKFRSGEEIKEKDTIVYTMPPKEKERIQQLIAAYDIRAGDPLSGYYHRGSINGV